MCLNKFLSHFFEPLIFNKSNTLVKEVGMSVHEKRFEGLRESLIVREFCSAEDLLAPFLLMGQPPSVDVIRANDGRPLQPVMDRLWANEAALFALKDRGPASIQLPEDLFGVSAIERVFSHDAIVMERLRRLTFVQLCAGALHATLWVGDVESLMKDAYTMAVLFGNVFDQDCELSFPNGERGYWFDVSAIYAGAIVPEPMRELFYFTGPAVLSSV